MKNSKVAEILEKNDRLGEQGIAFIQSFMAVVILALHLSSAVQNDWVTFNLGTLLSISLIITSSLYRLKLTQSTDFESVKFHILTIADGLLIFALLLSYNVAYNLELAAIFKSPSMVLFIIFTAARLVRFDPHTVLVAGGTVFGGWIALFGAALFTGGQLASDYTEYLSSQTVLVGAAIEMAVGYGCFLGILAMVTSGARRFLERAATVDELHAANTRAEESAANFESLYSSSIDAIIIVNRDGVILRVNPAVSELFGYRSDELVGHSCEVLMSAAHADALRFAIEQYLNTGYNNIVGKSFESIGLSKDGKSIDIELSITEFSVRSEIRFAAFIRDIRSRKTALMNEQRALSQFQSAVEAAMDAIIIIDDQGIVTGYNSAAEEIFGFSRSEMVGSKLSETIIPERYREAHEVGLAHYLKTGQGPAMNTRIEIEGLHANGEELQIELIIREINSAAGKRFFGYARDITAHKRNEEMLIRAKDEAEVATRAKARFLAIMSHEIRTALNGMLGVIGLLSDTRLNPDQKNLIGVAEESGRTLLGIINDILDFSKLEAGKFQIDENPFRLPVLLQSIRDLVEPQVEKKGLLFQCDASCSLAEIYNGDADRIRQVLLNLIWNAIKYTDTGQIGVRVSKSGAVDEHMVRFMVEDTGIGVPIDKKDQLFAEFATIDQHHNGDFQGTGLGLAISKAFVEAMGGKIGFQNRPEGGSQFWFEIPLEPTTHVLPQQTSAIAYGPGFQGFTGMRILIADDNLTNQMIVKRYLSDAGCHVELAHNGNEAVERFKNGNYDLVLMDISMPEMDGYEATAAIRCLDRPNSSLPIIAFTAYATDQDKARIDEAGMNDRIIKPFSRDHLINTIVRHLPNLVSDRCNEYGVAPENDELIHEIASGCDLDYETLETTLSGMDDAAVREIILQFNIDLVRYLELARKGLEAGDWDLLEKASHGLKGTSVMFGADRLRDVSGRVNMMCRNGMHKDIRSETNRLIEHAETMASKSSSFDQHGSQNSATGRV